MEKTSRRWRRGHRAASTAAIEQARSRGILIRAPSRTGSAAACSGQAWISARRPRPAVGVVSLCNCARRRGGGARLSHSSITRTTFPVESAVLAGRRVARASSSRKTGAVCSSCGRQKARMGTLLPADATRDKRSMLITPVALLEGWCRCQSLDIWRQTPCKDLLGASRSRRSPSSRPRHTQSGRLTPNSRIKSAR